MRVIVSPRAVADFERLRPFLYEVNPPAAERALQTLIVSIQSLLDFPGCGRPVEHSTMRELVVPFGKAGYVVRYFQSGGDIVVLRVWHSRELRE